MSIILECLIDPIKLYKDSLCLVFLMVVLRTALTPGIYTLNKCMDISLFDAICDKSEPFMILPAFRRFFSTYQKTEFF